MMFDGAGGIDHRRQPAVGSPFLQEARAGFGRGLVVEVLEGEPDLIGTRGLEMARGQAVQCRLLAVRQVGRIAQPYIACATQHTLSLLLGPPHLIDGIVDDLDGHVDADLIDRFGVTAMCCQIIGESGDGGGVLALGGEQHAGLVDIDEQGDVVVAAFR